MYARIRELIRPGETAPLNEAVSSAGWYPLAAITSLNLVDELDRVALGVFTPNIKQFFGINNKTLGTIVGIQVLVVILAAVPAGYLGTRVDRARLLRWATGLWTGILFVTSLAITLPLFVLARIGTGIAKAAVEPSGRSLLTDYYPPNTWNRVLAVHAAANPLGGIVGALLAGGIGLFAEGPGIWRLAFPLLAVPAVISLVAAARIREPTTEKVKTAGAEILEVLAKPTDLPLRAAVIRLLRIPSFKGQLVGIGILGFALVGMGSFGSVLFEEEFGIGEGGRGLIGAILATASLLGTLVGGRIGERLTARNPSSALRFVGGCVAGFSLVVAGAVFLESIYLVVPVLWFATLVIGLGMGPLLASLSAVSPPRLRPLMFALLSVFIALFGGFLGGVFVGAVADATNIRIGLASLAPFGIVGAFLMARGGATINTDIAHVEREFRQAQEPMKGRTGRDLALRVRSLNFSYDKLQILFDVELDVEEGEIVALLGTNGAGKSTLLRAVCGVQLPDRGLVHYFGEDVTWLEAEERVRKGMIQVRGGRGVFPSLSVLENLRTAGWPFRGQRARVEKGITEVFGYFPGLENRKNQRAGTLSGGEQQMLALGRAFIAGPRLLMIDELSLGLAPVIQEQLLGIVRAFCQRGTTLLLVEQSVTVALSVATTAYFMERGAIRFGGPAAELLDRRDLLRSVFLEGAGATLAKGI